MTVTAAYGSSIYFGTTLILKTCAYNITQLQPTATIPAGTLFTLTLGNVVGYSVGTAPTAAFALGTVSYTAAHTLTATTYTIGSTISGITMAANNTDTCTGYSVTATCNGTAIKT
jgi:hypothetical protein